MPTESKIKRVSIQRQVSLYPLDVERLEAVAASLSPPENNVSGAVRHLAREWQSKQSKPRKKKEKAK